jgi:hypothetical protein
MPGTERFIHKLMHRRGCTFRQRFVRLLIVTGPLLVVLEVLGSGVMKEPGVLPWFLVLTIPGTLLFVLIETTFEHLISRMNR